MTEPNPHALTGAYALDALDEAEYEQFRVHLAECESCPSEAAELRATAVRLTTLVERTPPAELRDRVLAAIERTSQLPPLPVSLASRRQTGRRRVVAITGGVLAAAAVTAGTFVLVNSDDAPSTGVPTVAEVLAAPDARSVLAEPGAIGSAQVVVSDSLDAAVIQVSDLPEPAAGTTYQAWVFEGDQVLPAATFEPGDNGVAAAVVDSPDDASGFGVTVEQDGGSPTGRPTRPPVIRFQLGA